MDRRNYPWNAVLLAMCATGGAIAIAGAAGASLRVALIAGLIGYLSTRAYLKNEAGKRGIPLWKIKNELGAPAAIAILAGGLLWFGTLLGCAALGAPDPAIWALAGSGLIAVEHAALFLTARSSRFVTINSPVRGG